MRVEADAPLKARNTFGIAAYARQLLHLETLSDLADACDALANGALVLGAGSNVLLTAPAYDQVALVGLRGIALLEQRAQHVLVEAAAGEPWHAFVRHCIAHGWYGLENLSSIPGTVGASPIQNIGAYGVEMAQFCTSVVAVQRRSGERKVFSADDCRWHYRDSVFKHPEGANWIIVGVRFTLERTFTPRLTYRDLAEHFSGQPTPSADAVSLAVSAIRARKLPDPSVRGNAGSFFKNPVVSGAKAQALQTQWPAMPTWPAELKRAPASVQQGNETAPRKLSAAWLIDQCGLKGYRAGDAGIDPGHALVMINWGQASGAQLLALSQHVQATVEARFGIALEPEPVIW